MYTLFVILIVIAALLMIGVVLIQESKGGGLSSNFSSSNAIMGVRKTTDFVEKTTWGLAIAMVILSVASAYVAPSAPTDESVIENAATQQDNTTNPNNLPKQITKSLYINILHVQNIPLVVLNVVGSNPTTHPSREQAEIQ